MSSILRVKLAIQCRLLVLGTNRQRVGTVGELAVSSMAERLSIPSDDERWSSAVSVDILRYGDGPPCSSYFHYLKGP